MKRDLLSIRDLSRVEILELISKAEAIKGELSRGRLRRSLSGKIVSLIFVKPSTRTRVSFEAAVYRLGGQAMFMTAQDTQISRQEPLADMARVLDRYIDAIVIRTFAQQDVEELASYAAVPVVNALTDRFHPCQVLADLLTIKEKRSLDDLTVAWVGDGNNVANSWINASARLGFRLNLSCPPGFEPDEEILSWAGAQRQSTIQLVPDPKKAVSDADVIYTDVWASMGQESDAERRMKAFRHYQVNSDLMAAAPPHALVLHCLPAHRGEEISEDVLEGPQSVVFDQAENRLHLQAALLDWLIGGE